MRVQAPPRCKPVAIDDLVLRQVAENLVSNALKYAPESGIEISVRGSAPGFWQLLVEDRGPGIPAAHQRELFKPFTRLRLEERRVGKACVSTCRSRWSPSHKKKNRTKT